MFEDCHVLFCIFGAISNNLVRNSPSWRFDTKQNFIIQAKNSVARLGFDYVSGRKRGLRLKLPIWQHSLGVVMRGPQPHPQKQQLIDFLNLLMERCGPTTNAELYAQLNISDNSLSRLKEEGHNYTSKKLKKRLDNLLGPMGSCSNKIVQLFLLHTGNLAWGGDPVVQSAYDELIERHIKPEHKIEGVQLHRTFGGQPEQFPECLLGSYAVYRASDEVPGRIHKAILNFQATRGRCSMRFELRRTFGEKSGYLVDGRVIKSDGNFVLIGAVLGQDRQPDAGAAMLSVSPLAIKKTKCPAGGQIEKIEALEGIYMISSSFISSKPQAMRIIAVREDDLLGLPSLVGREDFSRSISFARAANEIDQKCGATNESLSGLPLIQFLTNKLNRDEDVLYHGGSRQKQRLDKIRLTSSWVN